MTDEYRINNSDLVKSAEEKTNERRIKEFKNRLRHEKLPGANPKQAKGMGTSFQSPKQYYDWNDGTLK